MNLRICKVAWNALYCWVKTSINNFFFWILLGKKSQINTKRERASRPNLCIGSKLDQLFSKKLSYSRKSCIGVAKRCAFGCYMRLTTFFGQYADSFIRTCLCNARKFIQLWWSWAPLKLSPYVIPEKLGSFNIFACKIFSFNKIVKFSPFKKTPKSHNLLIFVRSAPCTLTSSPIFNLHCDWI